MKILVTGAAGFIGSGVCRVLLERGDEVVGLDNLNSYYDPRLKLMRLERLGVRLPGQAMQANGQEGFRFVRMDLSDSAAIAALFAA